MDRFSEHEGWHRWRRIDDGILERYRKLIGGPGSELHREFSEVRERLVESQNREALRGRRRFIGRVRGLLAHACLDSLEPDLVILDEFQRFRDLLDENTESGELAKRLFEYEDSHTEVRTLLLSATLYKMYTQAHETDDDHYRDFIRTFTFLLGKGGSPEPLRHLLGEMRLTMSRSLDDGSVSTEEVDRLRQLRTRIQDSLQRVMSRTERRGRDIIGDPMLEVKRLQVDLSVDEVQAYLQAQELAEAVKAPGVMEYWKSAPYLLSFMERYRLPQRLEAAASADSSGSVARLVRKSPRLQISRRRLSGRSALDGDNGRMRAFLRDLTDSKLQRLKWLPPVMPSYQLGREFRDAADATKRLVFSSWTMVPRAVTIMGSYDAERRYITEDSQEARYGLALRADTYPLFSLIAPSGTLANYGDPFRYPPGSVNTMLQAIEERLRPLVEEITRDAPTHGRAKPLWYAVAPLLLDGQTPESLDWIADPPRAPHAGGHGESAESITWHALVARIREGLGPERVTVLGRPPDDLTRVLALLALGSLPNASLRALARVTSTPTRDPELMKEAMRAGWAFRSLFRSPVAEGLLDRQYAPGIPGCRRPYWKLILAYATEGGLSDVLDEFFHVALEAGVQDSGAAGLVDELSGGVGLSTGFLEISEWRSSRNVLSRNRRRMHQHFARRYVSDRSAVAERQASQHPDLVRDAFNSPFWPFVLGTTSVGQEGLDFHRYCHAVVHWNLPSNPVDLEQREGRVHRYHGHAVRKNVAQAVGELALSEARSAAATGELLSSWDAAFRLADERFGQDGGLTPHWVFTEGSARIRRYAPVPPLSRDAKRLPALRRSLATYRMVFGQPRQEDFLEFILREVPESRQAELTEALTIDLTPP
ncbi:MAG: helicase-related protein [Chloroflexi bacterium]|nr:helicase-related protein [Chloroflexota bacterium]